VGERRLLIAVRRGHEPAARELLAMLADRGAVEYAAGVVDAAARSLPSAVLNRIGVKLGVDGPRALVSRLCWRAAADAGDVAAAYNLGFSLIGSPERTEGLAWIRLAADAGLNAQRLLVLEDCPCEDEWHAEHWYRVGAEDADAESAALLAALLIEAGDKESFLWCEAAAAAGDSACMATLGVYAMEIGDQGGGGAVAAARRCPGRPGLHDQPSRPSEQAGPDERSGGAASRCGPAGWHGPRG
jgi:TPR repeat protein